MVCLPYGARQSYSTNKYIITTLLLENSEFQGVTGRTLVIFASQRTLRELSALALHRPGASEDDLKTSLPD